MFAVTERIRHYFNQLERHIMFALTINNWRFINNSLQKIHVSALDIQIHVCGYTFYSGNHKHTDTLYHIMDTDTFYNVVGIHNN